MLRTAAAAAADDDDRGDVPRARTNTYGDVNER